MLTTSPDLQRDAPAQPRLLLAGIGAGVIGLTALAVLTHLVDGELRPITAVGRPILFAAVGALGVQGRRWPRVVLLLWTGCLALLLLVAATTLVRNAHVRDGVLFLALAALFVGSFLLLLRAGGARDGQDVAVVQAGER